MSRPDARELLGITRETLRDAVAPQLDGALRYQVLMAANALAIALRELDANESAAHERDLRGLYGDSVAADESLDRLERRLASDIRRGDFDGALEHGLRALLRARVESALAVSNPKRLSR